MRLLLALLAVSLLVAGSASAAAPTAVTPPVSLVITVKSVTTSVKTIERPPKGPSKGDRFVFADRLLNVARQFGKPVGARVGRDAGSLVMTSSTAGITRGVATLPGGTIRFGGTVGASPAPLTVLGGTGRYAGARGVLIVGAGDSPLNVYHLTIPATSAGTTV